MSERHHDPLEPWSYPIPHLVERAQLWHSRRYAAWLLRAGAEPRSGILLSSGDQATSRWQRALEEQGVEFVDVETTFARPLPIELTSHHGDHFNRRLFLIDGLDEITARGSDRERRLFWETLDGQRAQLKKHATWTTLLITHPQTIVDAYRWAPRLIDEIQRVCWIWDPDERRSGSVADRLPLSPKPPHRLITELFCEACSSDAPAHFQLGRIFRAGYPKPPRYAAERWRWGFQLWRGEARDSRAARFGQLGVTEALKEEISPDDALWASRGREEAATPARSVQWRERAMRADDAWIYFPEVELPQEVLHEDSAKRVALSSLRAWVMKQRPSLPPQAALSSLEAALSASIIPSAAQHSVALWLTRAYASHENLQGCLRVNRALALDSQAIPEARFCAEERLLELALFSQDHAQARDIIDRLRSLDLTLSSPHFESRRLRALGQQLGALDPSRGEKELAEAQQIEIWFGLSK